MELALDTYENCFLCLQTIPDAEKNKLCLTNICRFLQINISDVILEGLKEGDKDIDAFNYNLLQNMQCSFSVTLCNPCYGVTGKLSSIIHDLEVANLQVNYYSGVFQNILEKADMTSAAYKNTDNSQTADARMVKHLRKEAKQKCFAHNRRVLSTTTSRLPLVRLSKLTKETVTTMKNKFAVASITPSSALHGVGVDISHSSNATVKNEYSESFEIVDAPVSTGVLVDASSPEINEDGNENPMDLRKHLVREVTLKAAKKRKIDDSEESLNGLRSPVCVVAEKKKVQNTRHTAKASKSWLDCSHCKRRFLHPSYLRLHMICFHPENIFLSYKPVHRSKSQFAVSCRQVLERVTMTYSDNPKLAVPRQCSNCTKIHRFKKHYLRHLVHAHTNIIGEKIRAFEKKESQKVGFFGDTISGDASNELPVGLVKKENCNERCTGQQEGRKSPPLQVKEDKISTNHSTKTFKGRFVCNHCKSRYPLPRPLQFHLITHHPEQIFKCYKPVQRTNSQFADSCREIFQKETVGYNHDPKKTSPRQCEYCTKFHRYKQEYLYHLVYSHQKIIGEKIRVNSTKNVPERSKGRLACIHCKRIFHRSICLHYHMISHHPDQIFLRFKPTHLSWSQFLDSCREILERESEGYYNSNYNKKKAAPRQCAYCAEMRCYKRNYLKHLVNSHTNILGEKIKRFANGESQIGSEDVLLGGANQQIPVLDGSILMEGEMKMNCGQGKIRSTRLACSHCKKRLTNSYKLCLHMISFHPDQIFLSVKPVHRSESQFANSCRKIFEMETVGYGNATKKAVPQQCPFCKQMRWHKQGYLKHLAYTHTSIMREKIRAFENEEAQVGFRGLTGDAGNDLQVETQNCNETIDPGRATGESSQLNRAGNDNHSYPVVLRVEHVDQKNCEELLSGGEWNDVQVEVEGMMIKTEDFSESSSNFVPILVDPPSIDEFNNCGGTTNAITTAVSSSETMDIKYVTDN